MAINLGSDFNTALVTLAGLDPDTVDPSTVSIDMINPSGPTTLRVTTVASVDTTQLQTLIQQHTTPSTTDDNPTVNQ